MVPTWDPAFFVWARENNMCVCAKEWSTVYLDQLAYCGSISYFPRWSENPLNCWQAESRPKHLQMIVIKWSWTHNHDSGCGFLFIYIYIYIYIVKLKQRRKRCGFPIRARWPSPNSTAFAAEQVRGTLKTKETRRLPGEISWDLPTCPVKTALGCQQPIELTRACPLTACWRNLETNSIFFICRKKEIYTYIPTILYLYNHLFYVL